MANACQSWAGTWRKLHEYTRLKTGYRMGEIVGHLIFGQYLCPKSAMPRQQRRNETGKQSARQERHQDENDNKNEVAIHEGFVKKAHVSQLGLGRFACCRANYASGQII